MDQSEASQQQITDNAVQITYGMTQFHDGPEVGAGIPNVPMLSPTQQPLGSTQQQQQFPYPQVQHFCQQQQGQQQNKLQAFWDKQMQEVEETVDFKNHSLLLARIKKVMKADEDVRMISSEAPVLFAKACEMFILELTLRSWMNTEENKRRTLQKNDIAAAISRTDVFDFLLDIIPKDEMKEEALGVTRTTTPLLAAPADSVPYYYIQQQHAMGQAAGLYPDQQPHPTMPNIPWQPTMPYIPWQQPHATMPYIPWQQPEQHQDRQQNHNR